MKLEFPYWMFEENSNFKRHKNRPVAEELFNTGKQTDITKLTVSFRNYANRPKNGSI